MQNRASPITNESLQERILAILQLCEQCVYDITDKISHSDNEIASIKDLPAQLLKLVQLLDKIYNIAAEINNSACEQRPEINYEIIRKYLDKYYNELQQ